ncbi:MAG: adenylate/guanylate cyclase domain-containing protein, partial [Rhodocyclaceae bacterium]|nr:adenylate/guanylate cyclase domain-containing protein [Rhodocyclaceae bacterium]
GPTLAIGIGLHVGPAFVGYVGATHRHEYSAIGDTVNVAARLEGLTKEVGRPIVISAELRARLADPSGFECMGSRAIKGRSAMEVYGWTAQA